MQERRLADVYKVSIRSPHKSKGRPSAGCFLCRSGWFQSAPLTKARGDSYGETIAGEPVSFNPLPSQKQGETRGSSTSRKA